jgi:transcriptional regulator with XRE-family HTH domain
MRPRAVSATSATAKPSEEVGVQQEKPGQEEVVIGERLRTLRQEHRYSIRRLASLAGVSPSLISEVERGRVEPSISVLKRLATSLDTTLTYFFSEPMATEGRVVRADERAVLRESALGPGITFELLSPERAEVLEPVYGRYDVGASMGPVTHEGEEWGMVLRGRLKVWVGDEIYFLDVGDSIQFPSTIPHRIANAADEVTEYVWVNSQKSF